MTKEAVAFVLAILSLAACGGGAKEATGPSTVERPVCEVGFSPPSGFEPLETFREEYSDHIGLRVGFRDERRRELHAFAGIPGEFGEGLSIEATVELADGGSGWLLGEGAVWVLTWREGGVCDPRAVLGNGFDPTAFESVLQEAGILPA